MTKNILLLTILVTTLSSGCAFFDALAGNPEEEESRQDAGFETDADVGVDPDGDMDPDGTVDSDSGHVAILVFSQQPHDVLAGDLFDPVVEVSIQDGSGNVVASAPETARVTLSLLSDDGNVTMSSHTADTVMGVASFDFLMFEGAGTIALEADADGFASVESDSFTVSAPVPPCTFGFSGGSGTSDDPFVIRSAEHLADIVDGCLSAHYRLANDIDLGSVGENFPMIGSSNLPFRGTFDGDDRIISNFKVDQATAKDVGLFRVLGDGARLRNITMTNAEVIGGEYVGILVGSVAGTNGYAAIENVHVQGKVVGIDGVGGLLGVAETEARVVDSSAEVEIEGNDHVGGLIGDSIDFSGHVYRSRAQVMITGNNYVGGLIGSQTQAIEDSYATGSVTGRESVGGLVGWNYINEVRRSYARVVVRGSTSVGPTVGSQSGQGCTDCFYDWGYQCSATDESSCSFGGTELQTGEMIGQEEAKFPGFDFSNSTPWKMVGYGPPRLAWEEVQPCDLNSPVFVYASNTTTDRGTATNPHLICSHLQLNTAAGYTAGHFRLISDIAMDLLIDPFQRIGDENISFTGTFDGDGHQITNLFLDYRGQAGPNGMFRVVGTSGVIRDVVLTYAVVHGDSGVGALVGENYGLVENSKSLYGTVDGYQDVGGLVGYNSGNIIDVHTDGTVTGVPSENIDAQVGGLVGRMEGGSVERSTSGADVQGGVAVGGLIGGITNGSIFGSHATGTITGGSRTGGLVGDAESSHLETSVATGAVSGGTYTGGLVGYLFIGNMSGSSARITSCHSEGNVTGTHWVGGLLGYNLGGAVEESYAEGNVVAGGANSGGLVGDNAAGTVIASHSNNTVNGLSYVGGLVGRNGTGGQIVLCSSESTVYARNYAGGLVGQNRSEILQSRASGDVNLTGGIDLEGQYFGGLIGHNTSAGDVQMSYARGEVNGRNNVGGLVGTNLGMINQCYSDGGVTATDNDVGGLVGDGSGTTAASYWNEETSGQTTSAQGRPLSSTEMGDANNFPGWAFDHEDGNPYNWIMPQGGPPMLWWEE
ncbi:MAG: GLUG motif-containing protein [Bradymonadaceae bacterium]